MHTKIRHVCSEKAHFAENIFSDEFSCRRALARDLFKEVSYLGIASQASWAHQHRQLHLIAPLHCLSTLYRLECRWNQQERQPGTGRC